MGAIDQTKANNVLDALVATTSFVASTAPIKVKLITSTTPSTATTNGSVVSGGSYADGTVTFSGASSSSVVSNVAVTFSGMPAAVIWGVELWDSAATPKRVAWGQLTAQKTTNAGDTLTISAGSLTLALT